METLEQKTERNCRVQARYDELMREGKRGHYETMFRVVREEVEAERNRLAQKFMVAADAAHKAGHYAKRDELSAAAGWVLKA